MNAMQNAAALKALTVTLGDVEAELASATKALEIAEKEEAMARNVTTDARNTVNRLQKKLDHHAEELRRAAPVGTDWQQARSTNDRLFVQAEQREAALP